MLQPSTASTPSDAATGSTPISASRDATDPYFNNTNINDRNEGLKTLANGVDVFYLDVNPVYDDEEGNLVEDYSSDNIHLYGNKYAEWKQFFLDNGFYKKGVDPFNEAEINEAESNEIESNESPDETSESDNNITSNEEEN